MRCTRQAPELLRAETHDATALSTLRHVRTCVVGRYQPEEGPTWTIQATR
jgi:hypothetical protein